ncbi:MAG: tyrosine-type recombinase/integrase, partial [Desulfobacteraceae bacterium]|nr:tyrosine-type recombinase/integrase [Desulfobacteraceae bacterium]
MPVNSDEFFDYMDAFFAWRKDIYGASDQTLKSNRVDLNLFNSFISEKNHESITGPSVIDFQYYLKDIRNNCGGSINRKIFTLRGYSSFLGLMDVASAESLPFYNVLKVRQGYRNRPDALTHEHIQLLFEAIDRDNCLGIRNYAVYALMYETGLRVGEVFGLDLGDVDMKNQHMDVLGKGNKRRRLHLNPQIRQ